LKESCVWGFGGCGQLGLGDKTNRLAQMLVGAEAAFEESEVLTVACGYFHTMIVKTDGTLWTFGNADDGALGHNDRNTRLVPTRIEAQLFGNAKIVAVAGEVSHSAAVREEGTLYTLGEASGLGHINVEAKLVPTCITPSLLQCDE